MWGLLDGKKADSNGEHRTENKKWGAFLGEGPLAGAIERRNPSIVTATCRKDSYREVPQSSPACMMAGLGDVDGDEQNKQVITVAIAIAAMAKAVMATM